MVLKIAIIGISYESNEFFSTITYAREDALTLLTLLRERKSGADFFVAIEPEYTRAEILRQGLQRFFGESRSIDDTFFFFAGHGISLNQKTCFVASDAVHPGPLNVITLEETLQWMATGNARNRILFLDCCHAGQSMVQTGLASDVLAQRPGVSIISACDLGEVTIESQVFGGGLFSFMLRQALDGAAGLIVGSQKRVTVSSVFSFLAQTIPAWVNGNRQMLQLPAHVSMTPRWVADLRGDPVLTVISLLETRVASRAAVFDGTFLSEVRDEYQALADASRTAARRFIPYWRDLLHLDLNGHWRELCRLLDRCAADLKQPLNALEINTLKTALLTHDLGLVERHAGPRERFQRTASFIRHGNAKDVPIIISEPEIKEAVAEIVEHIASPIPTSARVILCRGDQIRIDLLGAIMQLAHRLSVVGHRMADDVGDDELSRLWVQRQLIAGISDWTNDGRLVVSVASDLDSNQLYIVQRWYANVSTILTTGEFRSKFGFGPRWLELVKEA